VQFLACLARERRAIKTGARIMYTEEIESKPRNIEEISFIYDFANPAVKIEVTRWDDHTNTRCDARVYSNVTPTSFKRMHETARKYADPEAGHSSSITPTSADVSYCNFYFGD
jgi:hypothetical protein